MMAHDSGISDEHLCGGTPDDADHKYLWRPSGWTQGQVKDDDGNLLIFNVEPASPGLRGVDVQICTELAHVFEIIENHCDGLGEGEKEFKITARWVTPEEFAREQEDWCEP